MPPRELDARGWLCPMPVLRAQKILKDMQGGEMLVVTVTDPHACRDFDLFCKTGDCQILCEKNGNTEWILTIKKLSREKV